MEEVEEVWLPYEYLIQLEHTNWWLVMTGTIKMEIIQHLMAHAIGGGRGGSESLKANGASGGSGGGGTSTVLVVLEHLVKVMIIKFLLTGGSYQVEVVVQFRDWMLTNNTTGGNGGNLYAWLNGTHVYAGGGIVVYQLLELLVELMVQVELVVEDLT